MSGVRNRQLITKRLLCFSSIINTFHFWRTAKPDRRQGIYVQGRKGKACGRYGSDAVGRDRERGWVGEREREDRFGREGERQLEGRDGASWRSKRRRNGMNWTGER